MPRNIHLTLLIGPGVPVPAPKPVIEALASAQVTTGGDRTGFQLRFHLAKTSPLQTTLLPAGFFDPGITRVILIATVGGIPNVLCDGMVTRQEVAPSSQPGQSMLTITGEDLTVLMDVVKVPDMRYPSTSITAIVNMILAKYAVFGIVPIVIPPIIEDIETPVERIATQNGTDYEYIKQLAGLAAYTFYIEPGPAPGMNLAYFGPDIRIPNPQPALTINMDAHTNVESLTFTLDGLKKKIVVMNVFDPVTGKIVIPLPLPNVSILRPPLGARPTVPMKIEFSNQEARYKAGKAILSALSRVAASADAVSGSGSLNVLRYGRPLKARHLVGVRGAGITYDGMYYVNTVTHDIKPGEYKQNFTISRDGVISQTPVVVT